MQSKRERFKVDFSEPLVFKEKLLHYYQHSDYFMLLDSNGHEDMHTSQQWIAAAGCLAQISCREYGALDALAAFYAAHKDWCFGYLSYDLKNELEALSSTKKDCIEAPLLHFFIPELIFRCTEKGVEVLLHNTTQASVNELIKKIQDYKKPVTVKPYATVTLKAIDSKQQYLQSVTSFLKHIQRGDIYEANFCTQFTATNVSLDAVKAYLQLNELSKPPFAVYAIMDAIQIMSASPERYIKKEGTSIISQPIKGTAKRSYSLLEDENLKKELFYDPKERSENVMIVDLVRNDLSKIASKGSVTVTELFGIYSFKQVHQMISTVTATLQQHLDYMDVLKASFPMGSMTGAPKVSAMELIEKNENFKRGIYSGAIGYLNDSGDMDFNVVIRTLLYNKVLKTVAFSVGSAITSKSVPQKEYDECLLKAQALLTVLASQGVNFQ